MKQTSKVLLVALLFSIPCKTVFAQLEAAKDCPAAKTTLSFAVDPKAKSNEAITVTISDLRFVHDKTYDDLAHVLKSMDIEDESSINQYLAAYTTHQSNQVRSELIAAVDRVVRDNKTRNMLLCEMVWLQKEFHEYVIRNANNNWKGYSDKTKAKMNGLVNKKIKELEGSALKN